MDEGLPSVSFLLLAAALLADIFVFGFGAAITRVKEEDVEKRSQENKDKVASGLLDILKDPEKHLGAINVFAMAVNMVLGGLVTRGIGQCVIRSLAIDDSFLMKGIIYILTVW